jgi:diaminopimelate epimerase
MDLSFYKLHSTGGDYIIISFLHHNEPDFSVFPEVAYRICRRRTGIGANGLLILTQGVEHALKAHFFPASGPPRPLSGDAIVCVGRFAFDSGLADNTRISCETDFGVVTVDAIDSVNFRIDLGPPRNTANNEEITPASNINLNETVSIAGIRLPFTSIRVISDYAVVNTERRPRAIKRMAEELSRSELLAQRQAVFMRSVSDEEISVYAWASTDNLPDHAGGTAACASAGILNGFCDNELTARFRSYLLYVQWRQEEGRLLVTAPSEYICSGSYYIDSD